MLDPLSEIFGVSDKLTEGMFFPDNGEIEVRPSDKKYFFNKCRGSKRYRKIFTDFMFRKKTYNDWVDKEIKYIVDNKANMIIQNYGTTGVGKSQLGRYLMKKIAYYRGYNIIFITDREKYESGDPTGFIKLRLSRKFKKYIKCYITYNFFETSRMVTKLDKMDMILQDEMEDAMGEDSNLIKKMITNVIKICARKNMVSVIFTTPEFISMKGLNFSIQSFGRRNNNGRKLTKDNMITYSLIHDKECQPFGIAPFQVWETKKENDFYEAVSEYRKGEILEGGGGSRVTPNKSIIDEGKRILINAAIREGITKRDAVGRLAKYIDEFKAMPSGMFKDVIAFAWNDYDPWLKGEKELDYIDKKLLHPTKKTIKKVKKEQEEEAKKINDKIEKKIKVEKDSESMTIGDIAKLVAMKKYGFDELSNEEITEITMIETVGDLHDVGGGNVVDIVKNRILEMREERKREEEERAMDGFEMIRARKPLVEYISEKVLEDFGRYYQFLWEMIIIYKLDYEQVSRKMEKESVERPSRYKNGKHVSYNTVGTDFKKIREGIKTDEMDEPQGMGYYVQDWWAAKHNDDDYQYFCPHNDNDPDYIHKDRTVDSIKSYWRNKGIYLTPSKDCGPEVDYCEKNGLISFRIIAFNLMHNIHEPVKRIVYVKDKNKQVKIYPRDYKNLG
jgi:hypothetical protein